MQEYTSPGEVQVEPSANAATALWDQATAHPTRPALAYRGGDGFVDVSTKEFADTVLALAAGLIGLGLEPGSRVCIFSSTRIEFTYLDYAIWSAGCVTVPIYETSSAEQVAWIVGDSGAAAIVCENAELKGVFDEVSGNLPDCRHAFVITEGGLDKLRGEGTDVGHEQVIERVGAVGAGALATVVYTSGTTGQPKGCELTHANLLWESAQLEAIERELLRPGESTLMFLPLAHIIARVLQIACVSSGAQLGFATSPKVLTEELPLFRPTFLVAVPRVFEKIYNGARQRAREERKGRIFDLAADVAIAHSRRVTGAGRAGIKARLLHPVLDRLVYRKLRAAMGGRVHHVVSGGAPLGARLGHFFHGLGVTPLEGYGLTETTAAATLSRPQAFRIGTVGQPVPGCSIRIAEDGEVHVRGGNVFRGYWNNEQATREALDEGGWFRTGDLGALDEDGYLTITGRKKEILVTAGGKNVSPAVLEDRLRRHRLISQAMVVGDGQPFIAALLTIDEEMFPRWLAEHGKQTTSVAELSDDPDLLAELQAAVDDANRAVSRAESIREFRVLPEDFTIEGGELTPTLKVKRRVVADRYADVIASIYGKA